ncbi:hypothetical protein [Borrelia miyamotoi]|uniref:Lipoprotein n=1 Tax=Borrelia miyamotoi TaxID=47466 RepID=A0AAQ2WXZ1_9SPIR|nr:hypothetical protein [Borrelia miyamotoi]AOW96357.1 hypothetical protein AXH25_04285 [Borrelia miyamotoi]QTL84077.1 hypothetical protein bmLB2001_001151 [Borrelia miyamotoi]WAZ85761.1 hypothetical protein O5400_05275 [Borrelia miyamotoi]WAZ91543.1 hypothetical protein O5398_05265 [Borrelia miyamotoi]WAZ92831.1 hypothetical protein O5402_05275 [Borrelia miyamotoi]
MARISMLLVCIVFVIACKQKNFGIDVEKNLEKVDSKKNFALCGKDEAVIKPAKIDSRYLAFYKLNRMVRNFRQKLNAKTFEFFYDLKIVIDFPIKQIFPLYDNPDDIYEGLGYDPIAIKSLELILNTLNLESNFVNEDSRRTYSLLLYLSDVAKKVKLIVNEKLDDATLERFKSERTAEDLTKMHFYLDRAMANREMLKLQLVKQIISVAEFNFTRESILKSLIVDILFHIDVVQPYFNMLQNIDIVLCLVGN